MPNRAARVIPAGIMWLSGIMFVTTVAAMVALTIAGAETSAIEALAKPLLTGLVLSGVVGAVNATQQTRLDEQDTHLKQIRRQTNGVLDQRIREQTKNALRELAEEERQARVTELGSDR